MCLLETKIVIRLLSGMRCSLQDLPIIWYPAILTIYHDLEVLSRP